MTEVKSSHILRHAKQILWDGIFPVKDRGGYVCWAVEDAGAYLLGSKTDPVVVNIKRRIMDRIDRCTVEEWLVWKVPGFAEWRDSVDDKEFYLQMQTYRHRWLDSLIAEYEAERD